MKVVKRTVNMYSPTPEIEAEHLSQCYAGLISGLLCFRYLKHAINMLDVN